jgi:uncharacterized protein (UPF0333 family)
VKKLAVLTVFAAVLLFAGCETKYYSVLITNELSKDVSYTYNGSSDTLASNTSKTYEVLAYTPPPIIITYEDGIEKIIMERNGDHFTFTDKK